MPKTSALLFAAAAPGEQGPSGIESLIATMMPLVLVFVIMYLILIRPQQKKANEHREMVNRIKAGDEVVTTGGIYGTVTGVKDQSVQVRIADKVVIEVARSAIATITGTTE